MADPLLTLMMFPRRWDPAGRLAICVAAMPFTNPLVPLSAGTAAFADTDLALDLRIIPSLLHLPRSADALAPISMPLQTRPNRSPLLKHAEARFRIGQNPPAPEPIGNRSRSIGRSTRWSRPIIRFAVLSKARLYSSSLHYPFRRTGLRGVKF
jgi:hypothetical protein